MLTGVVNIAVFAAFRCVITVVLLSNAAFKPVCGPHALDIWCYGRQKRHDRGKNGKVRGTVWTDFDRFRHDLAHPGNDCVTRMGEDDRDFARYAVVQGAGTVGWRAGYGTYLPQIRVIVKGDG